MTYRRLVSLALLAFDGLWVATVFPMIGWLRGAPGPSISDLSSLLIPYGVFILVVYLIDGYSTRTDMLSLGYASQHAIALLAGMVVMMLVTFVFIKDPYSLQSSRAVIGLSYVALIPLTLSYRRWLSLRLMARKLRRPVIFVGSQAGCVAFKESCDQNKFSQDVLYVATDAERHESMTPFVGLEMQPVSELLAILVRLDRQIEATVLDENSRDLPFAVTEKLMDLHLSGVPTYTLERFHEAYWRKITLQGLNQIWLFREGFEIARDPVYERLKRISDIGFALVGLTLASPLMLACAAVVWLNDRGPVFFKQVRIGKNRHPFEAYKFRTMKSDASKGDPYTRVGDNRITRPGRILRTTRLDELPQLWNVLNGDMSLIGPRAEWDRLVRKYEKEIPCYHFRHLVKPGVTGWAQVNYPYGANVQDTLRKMEYDLYYIRHFSFALDASIVLKTIHIMLGGKGR